MTPLREAMTRAMQMRGFSERTHHSYLMAATDLARWTKRSPADLSPVQVSDYFEYLVIERGLAPASCRLFFHGVITGVSSRIVAFSRLCAVLQTTASTRTTRIGD